MNNKIISEKISTLYPKDFPRCLNEIPDPPKKLFMRGSLPSPDTHILCVVLAFCFCLYAILAALIGHWKQKPLLQQSAERAVI
ncbi:hypothetical protein L0Y41_01985, partial [bacterium]|nr:hypothetical protein [bacterium]